MYGERHCENGPAVKYGNGIIEWWFKGNKCTESHYQQIMQHYHLYSKIIQEIKMY